MIYVGEECISNGAAAGISLANKLSSKYGKIIAFRCTSTGELFDLQQLIQGPIYLEAVLPKDRDYVDILRHDCEHILAEAVLALFPDAKLSVGAQMYHGFGYDFITDKPFTEQDLVLIDEKMRSIIKKQMPITREIWSIGDAKDFYEKNVVKTKVLKNLEDQGIQSVTMYKHESSNAFIDLCRGPHGSNTGNVPFSFKLVKVSAVQWSGDKDLPVQRITGVLFSTEAELQDYLAKLELAKERDHRKLAQKMDLYHIEDHTPGCVFWHPNGWTVIRALQAYIRKLVTERGYIEVETPALINADLWKRSGHWDKFSENMFCLNCNDTEYALKPMNCPAHVEIFKSHFLGGVKSYSVLPIRIAEFGQVYRNEATGALQGLKRLRKFTQDDAHIFCTPDQIEQEIKDYCDLFRTVYHEFGFTNYHITLSTRPEKRLGSDEVWDKAEAALDRGAKAANFDFSIDDGGGAFYGPKLDFQVVDALDRKWQCCTVQLDFQLPKRLEAEYIDQDGARQTPVMIHRAVYGSIERFLALVLENNNGYLPTWAAPVQCVVLPLGLAKDDDGKLNLPEQLQDFVGRLKSADLRFKLDDRNQSLGYKVREHTISRVENLAIMGKKELEQGLVTLKNLRTGLEEKLSISEAVAKLTELAKIPG